MFHHILVPLDGSLRAECALPVAARIARATGSSLLLLRVLLPASPPVFFGTEPVGFSPSVSDEVYQQAAAYLQAHAQAEALAGITVQTHLVVGIPAQSILACVETERIDLVVLSNQGATGLQRWVRGSVALKILRHSSAPVLVLSEATDAPDLLHLPEQRPVRVLVALDGSMRAEESLVPAAVLATALSLPEKGALHLVRVVPVPESITPVEAGSLVRQANLSEAQASLQMAVASLQGREHLTMTAAVVEDPDVAGALLHLAEGMSEPGVASATCDVIAIATHGRGGPERWVMRSIAERVLDGAHFPLLVIHASCAPKQYPPEVLVTPSSTMP